MPYPKFTKIKITKPESSQITKHLDFMWMNSLKLSENTPMWTGWNNKRFIEKCPSQRVEYTQCISFSPTRTDAVMKTIVQSKRVSEECGSTFAVITYDLAIAKTAKKVLNEEPDEFKDVFIMLGAFHIEGSIFSAIGKLIEGSFKPFLPTVNQISLFNLKTGQHVSTPTEEYLLTVLEEGKSNRHTNVEQCQKRGDRFEEPIKKSKISNFATEKFSKKNKSTQASKFQQEKGTLDIFCRLLFFPFTKQIDVKRIFAYPLVPEHPCFCHPDGSLCDSPKPNVFHYWKGLVQSYSPPNVETVIADGMPLIRSILHCRILLVICANNFEDCLKTNSSSRRYLFRCLRIDIT